MVGTNQLSARVFLQHGGSLKHVSFLAQFSSKLSQRIQRPISRYASGCQTLNARESLPSKSVLEGRRLQQTSSFNVITNGCRNEYKHSRLSSLGIPRCSLRRCRCGNSPLLLFAVDEQAEVHGTHRVSFMIAIHQSLKWQA